MKEIGGYFGLEKLIHEEYHADLISVNTARNALLYVLMARGIKKIYIPYFLCDVISKMLEMNDYDFGYYRIDTDFLPIFNRKLENDECIFIVNYYGQLGEKQLREINDQYKTLILDNSHAFFQRPIQGMDTIYSCRKFFGVPDGAYLSTDSLLDNELQVDVSNDRMDHILGRFEENASDYYNDFLRNDKSLDNEPLKHMSNLTKNILGAIDYNEVITRRNENYSYLFQNLSDYNKLQLIKPNGPFSYPLFLDNGMIIRKKLIENKIYIPILWPNVETHKENDKLGWEYSQNILPLPCDQRYDIDDMKFIVDKLTGLLEGDN